MCAPPAMPGVDSPENGPGHLGKLCPSSGRHLRSVGSQRPRNSQGALENYTDERWNRVLDINLNGIFATLRAGARLMRPQRAGRMIVTTSVAAYQCEPAIGAAYMTAKAGAAHLMRQVALELPPLGSGSTHRAGLRHQYCGGHAAGAA